MSASPSNDPIRMIAIVLEDLIHDQVNLVRAIYDRNEVERIAPHVPLIGPYAMAGNISDLVDPIKLMIGAHQPFMLELGTPGRHFDGSIHCLQMHAGQGADECQRLANAIARDLPIDTPEFDTPNNNLQPLSLTVGRFNSESDCESAIGELVDRKYFVVVQRVSLLEKSEDSWSIERTIELGSIREIGD